MRSSTWQRLGSDSIRNRLARLQRNKAVSRHLLRIELLEDRRLLAGEVLQFDTSLTSLSLTGGPYPMPLASDPANALGDSVSGYGFVDAEVKISLSSERLPTDSPPGPGPATLGTACAFQERVSDAATAQLQQACGVTTAEPINPTELDGERFRVDSFFDVFFDITVTDVDSRPGRDFAGMPDGASILLPNNGPAHMLSFYSVEFQKDLPNFGLIPPPQADPYIGHFNIEIPLGGDINGNGEDDKIKFTIATHAAGDENRTFTTLPDGTVIDEFDSAAFLEGAVVDVSTDPPFTLGAGSSSAPSFSGPGALTGPTTATSTLQNPVQVDVFPRTIGQLVIETPPPPGLITPNPQLPPEDGVYRTAADVHAEYSGQTLQIVLQDIRHRPVAGTTVISVQPGTNNEIEMFQSTLQGTAIVNGQAFPMELSGPVQVVSFGKVGNTTGTFDTEMLSMDLTGAIPGGPTIQIRESPSQPSQGQTTITDIGGGRFRVDSFFDIWTEVSIDGGSFIPSSSATHVDLVQPGIRTPDPQLPPTDGVYRTASDVHAEYSGTALQVVLQDIRHRPLADRITRTPVGPDELEFFISSLTGTALVDGQPFPVELSGPVEVLTSGKTGNTTGTFDTEMLSMDLTGAIPGGPTIQIRESPSQASTGQTSIRDLGGGHFQVDSFFDVWTEISLDGGQNWTPSAGPAHVELAPAPILVIGAGPARVNVVFEGPNNGDALDDNGNSLDEVVTELVQADFDGFHPLLGPIQIRLRDNQPSLGQIEELVNNTPGRLDIAPYSPTGGQSHSFFDVFFDVTVVATGQVLTTAAPTRVESIINHLPPQDGERYIFNPPQPVELIDTATGSPTGIFITKEIHDASPTVEHDIFARTVGQVLIQLPNGSQELITTAGPSQVDVYFEGPNEGDATDDDGDGLDEVVSELVQADLDGFHPLLGPVEIRVRNDIPSLGLIEEQANNVGGRLDVDPFALGNADSFFDVFFEIHLPATGQTLVTQQPTRVESIIDDKPPQDGERYIFNPPQPVELFFRDPQTGALTPSGIFIIKEIHDDSPTVEHDFFERTVGQVLIQLQDGSQQLITTAGPSQVDVYFEGPNEGDATDDDGDGLDEVVSELVQADLDGFHPLLGPVEIRVRNDIPSLGLIEEQANNVGGRLDVDPFALGNADSFFDVFFEIHLPATGQTLVTQQPTRVESIIDDKPPQDGERYIFNPPQPVELFARDPQTGALTPTGIFIVKEIHDDSPEVEHDFFARTVGQVLIQLPGGSQELITTAGPSQVDVYFEGPNEGDATDDDGDGLDEVVSELVQADLDGFHPQLGPVQIRLRNDLPSLGLIEEQVNNNVGRLDVDPFAPGNADSFFDVFFEIRLPATGQTLVTLQPTRVESIIDDKPPQDGERYIFNPPQPVELFVRDPQTGALTPTGIFIVREIHDDSPTVEVDRIDPTTALLQLVGGPLGPVPVPFVLRGSSEVHVYFEGNNEGDATDDTLNGLDEVVTELISLNLSGGGITLTVSPAHPSLGLIEEQVNNNPGLLDLDPFAPGNADSFFDVFFEIDVGGGLVLHNDQAVRIQSMISEKPPIARYFHIIPPTGPIQLLDQNNNASGVFLVKAEHYTGFVEVDIFNFVESQIELILPSGPPEIVDLSGSTKVHVFFERDEGTALDNSGNGLDEVQTEIVSMNLTGNSSLGPVEVRLRPNMPAPGQIEEQVNSTPGTLDLAPFTQQGTADSFFDVFFEIEINGQVLHTETAKRMSSVITAKPPALGETFENTDQTPLFDANGNPTGFSVGTTTHTPVTAQPTTTVSVDSSGNLVITDTDGGDSDDDLTIRIDGSVYVISDPVNTIGTSIPLATGDGSNEVRVPTSVISPGSGIIVNTVAGDDALTVADGPYPVPLSVSNTQSVDVDMNASVAGLTKLGDGTAVLATPTFTPVSVSSLSVTSGELVLNGSIAGDVVNQARFTGNGQVTGNVSGGGFFSPGNNGGIMTIVGSFAPTGEVNFLVNRIYATPGTDYDQYIVNGSVDLSGANLTFSQTLPGVVSTLPVMTLIANDLLDPTTPSTNPTAGTPIPIGPLFYTIDYAAGSNGNDVVLTQQGGVFQDGTGRVTVSGSNSGDAVRVLQTSPTEIQVQTSFGDGGGQVQTFANVSSIVVLLFGGNDAVDIRASVPAIVHGGAGNDSAQVFGGVGILVGGAGFDSLFGTDKSVILIGGADPDNLIGSLQADLLIGGKSTHEDDLAALDTALGQLVSGNLSDALATLEPIMDDLAPDIILGRRNGADIVRSGAGDRVR